MPLTLKTYEAYSGCSCFRVKRTDNVILPIFVVIRGSKLTTEQQVEYLANLCYRYL